jgi:hypothetical protein
MWICLRGGNSGAKTSSASANYGKIGLKSLHDIPPVFVISPPGWRKSITAPL